MNSSAQPFGYGRDPLCLGACAAYAVNRWIIPLAVQPWWWRGHFADLLMIPAALPWWLWLERRLGWRRDDAAPRWREVAFGCITWGFAAEVIAPHLFTRATGDVWDLVAYLAGAGIAGVCWRAAAR